MIQIISIMSIVTIVLLIVVSYLDRKEIKGLRQMGLSKDKYISLLEVRLRNERIAKNKEFNKKSNL